MRAILASASRAEYSLCVQSYVYQILKAMQFCHAHRVLHRDLKPQNILYDRASNTVKVADFGLARCFTPPLRPYTHEVTCSSATAAAQADTTIVKCSMLPLPHWYEKYNHELNEKVCAPTGGDTLVQSTGDTVGLPPVFHTCGYLEHWLHFCGACE